MTRQEEGFQEAKLTTVKLAEPFKIKLVPFAKGSKVELTLNGNEYLADKIRESEGSIVQLIRAFKEMCETELGVKFIKDEVE